MEERPLGYDRELGPGRRAALLLVDFAEAYFHPDSPLYARVEKERDVAARLLEAWRKWNKPVVWTRVHYGRGAPDGGLFMRKLPELKLFEEGSELACFASGLEPREAETVVVKQYASAFFGTSLASTLQALDVDTLLITGLTTSGCVRATAVDCLQHGFRPLVIEDAVGDREQAPHEANLFDLRAKYADIWRSAAVLDAIERL